MLNYNKAIQFDPEYYSAYFNRAFLLESTNEYDKALDDYKKAIELSPKDPNLYGNYARLKIEIEKYNEAKKLGHSRFHKVEEFKNKITMNS